MNQKNLLKTMGDEKERIQESLMRRQMATQTDHARRGNTPLHKTRRFGHNH